MAKMLDFRKSKKPTLPIMLDDDLVVNIYTPSKDQLEEILDYQKEIESMGEDDNRDKLNIVYDLCTRILSNNREGREFGADEVAEYLDTRDTARFFRGYIAFVAECSKEKN